MRVLLIEDDQEQVRELVTALRRRFPTAYIDVFTTQDEFENALPSIATQPPDVLISDILLRRRRVRSGDSARVLVNSEIAGAGFECVERFLEYESLRQVPVIVHSVLDRGDVAAKLARFPNNVVYSRKDIDHSVVEVVASILRVDRDLESRKARVFLVHGHNAAVRASVARFLERMDVGVVILDEQVAGGRTIVEQLEKFADVDYAVVLLTADDKGALKDSETWRLRARQNVIFELGFFAARLGRDRVCCIYEADVEIPTDYQAVLYVAYDSAGAWKASLARELRAAGIHVDLNRAFFPSP